MDIARIETELSESQLGAELAVAVEEAVSSNQASKDLKESGLSASAFRITPTANMGGLGEAFLIAVVGAIAKKLIDELWTLAAERLRDRHPGQIHNIEPTDRT